MLLVVTIVISICTLYVIFIYFKDKKKHNFSNVSGFIQTLSVFVAIWFSVYAVIQSDESVKESNEATQNTINELKKISSSSESMDAVLDSVSNKLAGLPTQIDSFAISINKLNAGVSTQQEEFKKTISELNTNVSNFSNSLGSYKGFIDEYNGQMERIVNLTNKQLDIWEKQQEVVSKEYNRRAIFEFTEVNCFNNKNLIEVRDFVLMNVGDIEAEINSIYITIPMKNITENDLSMFEIVDSASSKLTFRAYSESRYIPKIPYNLGYGFYYTKDLKFPYLISAIITFTSKYENKIDTIYYKINNCK